MTSTHGQIRLVAGMLAVIATLFFTAAVASAQSTRRVSAHSTDHFTMVVAGASNARLVIDGDRDTDLDLYVYDEQNRLLAYDDDGTDYCIARWYQRTSGRVRIVVVNLGEVYNEYTVSLSTRSRYHDTSAP